MHRRGTGRGGFDQTEPKAKPISGVNFQRSTSNFQPSRARMRQGRRTLHRGAGGWRSSFAKASEDKLARACFGGILSAPLEGVLYG
jgi:hypothetical protein